MIALLWPEITRSISRMQSLTCFSTVSEKFDVSATYARSADALFAHSAFPSGSIGGSPIRDTRCAQVVDLVIPAGCSGWRALPRLSSVMR